MNDFSILIPTYNEKDNILNLIKEIQSTLVNFEYEIIVIDDNSPDKTAELVKEFARESKQKNILCIERIWQKGLSSAVIEGMAVSNSELIVIMDGDGQHDPKNIIDLIEAQKKESLDLVIGSRFLDDNVISGLSEKRSSLSKIGIKFTKPFIDQNVTDPLTGLFLIRRSILQRLQKKLYKDGFKILFDILMLDRSLNSKEIQINFRSRILGDSKLNLSTLAHLVGQIVDNISYGLIPSTFFVFSLIGSIGVSIHLTSLYIFLEAGHVYIMSNFLGSALALTSNYFLNNFLTFNNLHNSWKKRINGLVKYAFLNSLSLMANIGVASLLYLDNFSIAVSTLMGITAGLLLNYFLSRNIVFKH